MLDEEEAATLAALRERLEYVEGSIDRACEYLDGFRSSLQYEHWEDARVYFRWLHDAYGLLTTEASRIHAGLLLSTQIPLAGLGQLNLRLKFVLDGLQVLGLSIDTAKKLLARVPYEPSRPL